jgi:septum formation protein
VDFHLASQSPRRSQLLQYLDYTFDIVDGHIDETPAVLESDCDYVVRMARSKAYCGLKNSADGRPVLGADTTISVDNEILAKPESFEHSRYMLRRLSGRAHKVLTAVCVVNQERMEQILVTTIVTMRSISDDEIKLYWQSGEPCDKAGSYAIQGIGRKFVKAIDGSYSAVVGLPLVESEQLLKMFLSR